VRSCSRSFAAPGLASRALTPPGAIRSAGIVISAPADKTSYVDGLQLWLKEPLPRIQLEWVAARCDSIDVRRQSKRWDPAYQMRLQMRRPRREALQWLATLTGVLMNYAEIGLDWTFTTEEERDAAHEFVINHHIKRWHGDQRVTFHKGTRYTANRRVPNKLVSYADRPSRMTGEIHCVHVEWRLNGARTLRRAGIGKVSELLDLDHHQFWKNRLLLRRVNLEALGRQYNVHVLGKGRRRGPWIAFYGPGKSIRYNFDARAGYIVMQTSGSKEKGTRGTTQAVVDEFRKHFDVSRCLEALEITELLAAG
jgi:hypothetical protein